MTTGWRKIARDIGQDRVRSALAVAAIALGISAFLAVLSSYAILDASWTEARSAARSSVRQADRWLNGA